MVNPRFALAEILAAMASGLGPKNRYAWLTTDVRVTTASVRTYSPGRLYCARRQSACGLRTSPEESPTAEWSAPMCLAHLLKTESHARAFVAVVGVAVVTSVASLEKAGYAQLGSHQRGGPLRSLMDFHGQKLSEALYYYIIIICGAIGWLVGFAKESFLYTFYGWAVGMVLSLLVCCPDWPFYNRHKVEWLVEIPKLGRGAEVEPRKASTSSASATGTTASGSKKDKKSKKA